MPFINYQVIEGHVSFAGFSVKCSLGFYPESNDTEFGDLFFTEDKGKENGESTFTKERKKSDFCRAQAVKYWRLLIPSFVPLDMIESVSLHCHRLEPKLMGTARLQSSETVHYEKITLTIPTTGDLGSQTAHLLLGLLSLKRNNPHPVPEATAYLSDSAARYRQLPAAKPARQQDQCSVPQQFDNYFRRINGINGINGA